MTRDTLPLALILAAIVASALLLGALIVALIAAGIAIARSEYAETCGGVALLAIMVFGALATTEATR